MSGCDAFNEFYDPCVNICNATNIEVPSDYSRIAKRTRICNQNIFNSKKRF
jgi:hypothetical protein